MEIAFTTLKYSSRVISDEEQAHTSSGADRTGTCPPPGEVGKGGGSDGQWISPPPADPVFERQKVERSYMTALARLIAWDILAEEGYPEEVLNRLLRVPSRGKAA